MLKGIPFLGSRIQQCPVTLKPQGQSLAPGIVFDNSRGPSSAASWSTHIELLREPAQDTLSGQTTEAGARPIDQHQIPLLDRVLAILP